MVCAIMSSKATKNNCTLGDQSRVKVNKPFVMWINS